MANTFRPERKPITSNSNENQKMLQDMEAIRKMAESGSDDDVFMPTPTDDDMPSSLQDVIKGPIPNKVKNAMQQQGIQPPAPKSQMREPRRREIQAPTVTERMSYNERVKPASEDIVYVDNTNSKLQDILASIQQVNYEEVYLPSKGKFYDGKNGPIDGIIHLKPMTGAEEEILATQRFVQKGQAINMIFRKCMQENYNPEDFLTVDRTYMLIYLRGISYSPEYDVEIKCPNCNRRFATSIDLNDLYVDQCPDDFDETTLSGVLPTTQLSFKYRLSRGMDEKMINDYRDRKSKGDNVGQSDDTLIFRTSLLITEISGITETREIQVILKQLPISDVAYLRNITSEPGFGVDTKIDMNCSRCTEEFSIDLPLEANFFFPRNNPNKNYR